MKNNRHFLPHQCDPLLKADAIDNPEAASRCAHIITHTAYKLAAKHNVTLAMWGIAKTLAVFAYSRNYSRLEDNTSPANMTEAEEAYHVTSIDQLHQRLLAVMPDLITECQREHN